MKTLILSIFVAGCIFSTSIAQVAGISSLNPLSKRLVLTAEGGLTITKSDFKNSSFNFYSRFMGEYFFETNNTGIFGLRAFVGYGYLSGDGTGLAVPKFKTTIINTGAGLNYLWAITEQVFPYAYLGVSYLLFDPKDGSGNKLPNNRNKVYSRNEINYQGELGIRFLVDKNISLNFNGGVNYVNTDRLDDIAAGTDNDIYFTFMGGISVYLGGVEDSDKDGIVNEFDVCPETPQGVRVDEFGCPVDTDKDGVPDYIDRCPQTRSNIIVNADGCPLDSDLDGVPDYLDLCANTSKNIPVDFQGCPLDADDDGIPDHIDKCPETPNGTEVDKFGCPLVTQVKTLPKITTLILSGESSFAVGRSELTTVARQKLDDLVKIMKEHPDSRWRIEGHTDNTGSYQTNKKLSLERAWAVADYLIGEGIEADRLVVEGSGSDFPVADNSTISGRMLNRRVSIEMIDSGPGRIAEDIRPVLDVTSHEYNSAIERNIGNMIFTDGNLYCYQVSSWRSKLKAEAEANKFSNLGFDAFVIEVKNIRGLEGTWYRVRIGYFNSLQEARNSKSKINR